MEKWKNDKLKNLKTLFLILTMNLVMITIPSALASDYSNLLKNPNAFSGFDFWSGSELNWGIGGGEWTSNARGSESNPLSQIIDMSTNLQLSEIIASNGGVAFNFSNEYSRTYCGTYGQRQDRLGIKLQAYDVNGRLLGESDKLYLATGACNWQRNWQEGGLKLVLTADKTARLDHLKFSQWGKDAENWAGNYGPSMRNLMLLMVRPEVISLSSTMCSPTPKQLELYRQADDVTLLSQNAMAHSHKASEMEKSMDKTSVLTKNDLIIVENTDESRFVHTTDNIPAKNKVICAKVLENLDAEVHLISSESLCSFRYVCNFNPDRYPAYLFTLECTGEVCNDCRENTKGVCQSHGTFIPVIEKESCNEWRFGQKILPTACSCSSRNIN